MSEQISGTPFAAAIGIEFVDGGEGWCEVRVPWGEHLVGDPDTGTIHGGVLTAALDNASGSAVPRSHLPLEERAIATLDLRIDYMRAATPRQDIHIRGECYHQTRRIAFVRAVAWQADPEDIVAASVATFMMAANRAQPWTSPQMAAAAGRDT